MRFDQCRSPQSNEFQLPERSDESGLQKYNHSAEHRRLNPTGGQQQQAIQRPEGVTGHHRENQRATESVSRSQPGHPGGEGNQNEPRPSEQSHRQSEQAGEWGSPQDQQQPGNAREDGVGESITWEVIGSAIRLYYDAVA